MKKAPLVCQYLENVSRELLSEYRDVIQRYIRRRNGIYALFMAALLAAGCGKAVRPVENPPARTAPRPVAPVVPVVPAAPARAGGLQLPEAVEGLKRGEVQRYGDPRLGYSVAYISAKGLKATVFVYDAGLSGITNGISEAARAQFAQAKGDIVEMGRRGRLGGSGWLSVVELKGEEEVSLGKSPGAPKMLHAAFKLGTEDGEALSDLYLTGDRGNFLKIRCTYPAAASKACEEERARLFEALGDAVKKPEGASGNTTP